MHSRPLTTSPPPCHHATILTPSHNTLTNPRGRTHVAGTQVSGYMMATHLVQQADADDESGEPTSPPPLLQHRESSESSDVATWLIRT